MHCGYFDTTRKGNHSKFSETNRGWWATLLHSEICAESDPPSVKNAKANVLAGGLLSTESSVVLVVAVVFLAVGFVSRSDVCSQKYVVSVYRRRSSTT